MPYEITKIISTLMTYTIILCIQVNWIISDHIREQPLSWILEQPEGWATQPGFIYV